MKDLTPYVSFLSMILNTARPKYNELLPVDVQNDANGFLANVGTFVVHQLLTLTTYRSSDLFKKFDGSQALTSVTLKDLVFIIKSAIRVVEV